ncbi:TonB-dependent receptor [Helicobacter saguini]|uniref:TonB-dependent receptor n=1 Tax=Helicobacter saguini TaxID=1548018 RepID=A0A347VRH4_9HELI|nr:TonB-dependent receptor [Helicobacter saguini]MWV62900.1 TonB-dependent receptor [Helicobacter saguini]MWV66430.1 TonB-dependent receptor [Helicobacter saguini]MWV68780.1 TonB-dependent receptor [Helicobacter saguini]MWV71665.1 TonB-dependent receptor [Helicobacter saguini]TLD94467.1 hypothetical protein LS64_005945 [Helicobacter saguini]
MSNIAKFAIYISFSLGSFSVVSARGLDSKSLLDSNVTMESKRVDSKKLDSIMLAQNIESSKQDSIKLAVSNNNIESNLNLSPTHRPFEKKDSIKLAANEIIESNQSRPIKIDSTQTPANRPIIIADSNESPTTNEIDSNETSSNNTESNANIKQYDLEKVTTTMSNARTQREIFDLNDNIASVSGESLEKLNIQNSKDLQNVLSGLYIGDSGGSAYPQVSLRGINSADNYKPSFRLYIDDVPQDVFFMNQELLDVYSVELFKGMSGTMYGENAQAGILSINSNMATNTTRLRANVGFSNLNRIFTGSASGAIIKDKLYAKLSFKHSDFLGQIKDSSTNRLADTTNINLGRFSLLYDVERFYVGLDYYFDKSVYYDNFYLTPDEIKSLTHSFQVPVTDSQGNNTGVTTRLISKNDRTMQTYALKGGYYITDNILLKNTFSIQNRLMPVLTDYSGLKEENNTAYINETRLMQTYDNDSVSIYGIYFSYGDFKLSFLENPINNSNYCQAGQTCSNLPYTRRVGDINKIGTFNFALFTDHKIKLPLGFDVTLGLRYTYYRDAINFSKGGATNSSIASFANSIDSNQFSPRIALSYTLLDSHKFYTSFARGFKAGGFKNEVGDAEYTKTPYKPETNYTAEVGYKGFFWDDRIYINLDYFYTFTQNRQEFLYLGSGNTGSWNILNVGNLISQGVEFEGKVQFLKDSFFMLNFAYTNAKYKNARDPFTGESLDNRNALYMPEFNVNASLDSIIWGNSLVRFYGNLSLAYKSRIYLRQDFYQEPYTLFNFGLRAEMKNISLAFYMNNALNLVYSTYGYTTTAGVQMRQIGRLQEYGMNVSLRF